MKKRIADNLKVAPVLLLVILLTGQIDMLPWWGFIVPVILIGILSALFNWQIAAFTIGFLSGFIVWAGASYYFEYAFGGTMFHKLGALMSVPGIVVILLSGLVCGLLSGLGLYAGRLLFSQNRFRSTAAWED
jgi:hypothetical protein